LDDFERDDQTTIALYLLTSHGRATPLVWKTVKKSELKSGKADTRTKLSSVCTSSSRPTFVSRCSPTAVFGDQARYEHLDRLGFSFVIRFRDNILVQSVDGESKTRPNGFDKRPGEVVAQGSRHGDRTEIGAVVCMKAAGMADAWCLATNRTDLTPAQIVDLYGAASRSKRLFRTRRTFASVWDSPARASRIRLVAIAS